MCTRVARKASPGWRSDKELQWEQRSRAPFAKASGGVTTTTRHETDANDPT